MNQHNEIRRISDLPYYKKEHAPVMEARGIHNLDDLLDTLHDHERSKELVGELRGIGPKIVDHWIELIEDYGVFEEEESTEEEVIEETAIEEIEPEEEVIEETAIEEEAESTIEDISEVVEEGGYIAAPKPELDDEARRLLELRKATKLPQFKRQEWFRYKKLGEKYRRPKGMHSKMRRKYKYRPPMASVGYKTPVKVRHKHSSGFEEVLVHNPNQLEGIDPKTQAARMGHTVGYKKRLDIEKRAAELGIHILNRTR